MPIDIDNDYPHAVSVPDITEWLGELEQNFGPVGDKWRSDGNTIHFREQEDADAVRHVLRLYSPRADDRRHNSN